MDLLEVLIFFIFFEFLLIFCKVWISLLGFLVNFIVLVLVKYFLLWDKVNWIVVVIIGVKIINMSVMI